MTTRAERIAIRGSHGDWMTLAERIARYLHKWQAADSGHGPFTAKCICNHHARGIVEAIRPILLGRIDEVALAGMGELISRINDAAWADGFRQGHLAAKNAIERTTDPWAER